MHQRFKKLIVPLLEQTSVDVKEATQSLGPIPSVGYAHRREQNKRKWLATKHTTLMSKEEENIFVFLHDKQSTEEVEQQSPPPPKRPRRSTVTPAPAKSTDDIVSVPRSSLHTRRHRRQRLPAIFGSFLRQILFPPLFSTTDIAKHITITKSKIFPSSTSPHSHHDRLK